MGMKWCLTVLLICISLKSRDGKCLVFLIYLLSICMYIFFGEMSIQFLCLFCNGFVLVVVEF